MEKAHIGLVLAIVALAIAASIHSPLALVLAIIALVLALSKEYEEVATVLAIVALILSVLAAGGILPIKV